MNRCNRLLHPGVAFLVLLGLAALASPGCSKPPPDPDDVGRPATGGRGGSSSSGSGGSDSSGSGGSSSSGSGGSGTGGGAGSPQTGSGGAAGSGAGTTGGASGGGTGGGAGGNAGAGGGAGGGATSDGPMAETGPGSMGGSGGAPVKPLPPGVQGHPSSTVDYPSYPGFTLALVEEFDQPLDLDTDPVWTWSDGGLSEGKVRFVKNGISFRDGKMVLTAREERVPGSASFAEPVLDGDSGTVPLKPVSSGEMRTKFNNYRYGRYEVRMKPPTSNGNFISTMFVFRTPKFYQWREIDIEVTADRPNGVFTNLIFADNVGGWNPDIAEDVERFPSGPGAMPLPAGFKNQGEFHTYAFEWLPDRITWFVDGVPIRVKTPGGKRPIPQHSAKILMNLWIFSIANGFGGADPGRNVYPMTAEYEWFRFYKWDREDRYPCAGPPACLPAEDKRKSKNNPADGLQP